jgi:hypothetical protein
LLATSFQPVNICVSAYIFNRRQTGTEHINKRWYILAKQLWIIRVVK